MNYNITLTNHEKCLNNLDELLFAKKMQLKRGKFLYQTRLQL